MIKFVILFDSREMTHCFDHASSIIIGSGGSAPADLIFDDESLQSQHVQILKQSIDGQESFFVINLAHDPFATLNDVPFGKQPLKNNDLIQIGSLIIRIEIDACKKSAIEDEELSPNDVAALVQQVEALAANFSSKMDSQPDKIDPQPYIIPETMPQENSSSDQSQEILSKASPLPSAERTHKPSLKDYYLSEYDDDESTPTAFHERSSEDSWGLQAAKSWRLFFKIFAGFIAITVVSAALIYVWFSDRSGEEEITASKGIADIAMALTYAQIKHIHPQNQNWSDPEFIKNNLTAVLGSEFNSLADFDTHGKFFNCPYMLRIYTNSDLSHFLVIAQPAPSVLQWLIPKASIVIDSQAMEMRKIKDLKALNRLLVNANTLDRANSREISSLIHQGELIPLADLISKKENQGFSPPKALALIRPNAENYIYNVPRYYPLGQQLLKKSVEIVERTSSSEDVALLQQELAAFNKFSHLVLYSPDGIQHAIQAQKALNALAPKEGFLIAYLQLNTKGKISSTHLLMDDTPSDIPIDGVGHMVSLDKDVVINFSDIGKEIHSHLFEDEMDGNESSNIDKSDPLFLYLSALAQFRQQNLKPLSDEIIKLLTKNTQEPQPHFSTEFLKLQEKYFVADEELQSKMVGKLSELIREHAHIPASKLMDYIKAVQLESVFQNYLSEVKQKSMPANALSEKLDKELQAISESGDWHQLHQHVTEIAKELQLENITDEAQLIEHQNKTKSSVIEKLNQFLLSSTSPLPQDAFTPQHQEILAGILQAAWITDPDTREFYLGEFDLRAGSKTELLKEKIQESP